MAPRHLARGDAFGVAPPGSAPAQSSARTPIRPDATEVKRALLRAGARRREHHAPGQITPQCVQGEGRFEAAGGSAAPHADDRTDLASRVPHARLAHTDAALLATLLLRAPAPTPDTPAAPR